MFDEINAFDIYKEPPFSFLNYFTFTVIGSDKVYNLDSDLYVGSFTISSNSIRFKVKAYKGYDRFISFIEDNSYTIGVCFSNSFNSKIVIGCYKDKFKNISFTIDGSREIEITIPICEYKYNIITNEDEVIYLTEVDNV